MLKALWKERVLAESENTILIEGNHYFPPGDVKEEYLVESEHRTTCPWKGLAHYYHLRAGEDQSENAVWSYPEPKEKARQITGYYAFGKEVIVEGS